MGELEAFGDAITGGVLGRAIEPNAGEAAQGHTHERQCLNCGAQLTGPYCQECGQHAHVHRTLGAFFHDFAHGVLHFEGKIWRTLPMLVWRPGELTRRYIDGQRARFVSPIALFLFCVFLMFAAIGLVSHQNFGELPPQARADIARERNADQQKLIRLQAERDSLAKAGQPTEGLDAGIAGLQQETQALGYAEQGDFSHGSIQTSDMHLSGKLPNWLRRAVGKAKANPELLFYKLKTNAYKFSWALVPISVPFVWLLFPFSRRFKLYDHTVFVTYSLCFMMLLLAAGTLVGLVSNTVASFAWFVPPIHMYRQLRGTYGVGKWGAVWRTSALTIFAFIAIGLFASLLVAVGAFE
ncbi:MAG TPA: DUF3667 domain-containing protein [Sphingomicrobium sp.]|nr:DUF3667 domain-containing protein [Sphingomicrobium sp.]